MAKNFVWDYHAAGDLILRSKEIADVCEARAAALTRATGVKYVADVRLGTQRVSAAAKTSARGDPDQTAASGGTETSGYWRTGKNGKRTWVKGYRRKK